jgi:hypothetical protein
MNPSSHFHLASLPKEIAQSALNWLSVRFVAARVTQVSKDFKETAAPFVKAAEIDRDIAQLIMALNLRALLPAAPQAGNMGKHTEIEALIERIASLNLPEPMLVCRMEKIAGLPRLRGDEIPLLRSGLQKTLPMLPSATSRITTIQMNALLDDCIRRAAQGGFNPKTESLKAMMHTQFVCSNPDQAIIVMDCLVQAASRHDEVKTQTNSFFLHPDFLDILIEGLDWTRNASGPEARSSLLKRICRQFEARYRDHRYAASPGTDQLAGPAGIGIPALKVKVSQFAQELLGTMHDLPTSNQFEILCNLNFSDWAHPQSIARAVCDLLKKEDGVEDEQFKCLLRTVFINLSGSNYLPSAAVFAERFKRIEDPKHTAKLKSWMPLVGNQFQESVKAALPKIDVLKITSDLHQQLDTERDHLALIPTIANAGSRLEAATQHCKDFKEQYNYLRAQYFSPEFMKPQFTEGRDHLRKQLDAFAQTFADMMHALPQDMILTILKDHVETTQEISHLLLDLLNTPGAVSKEQFGSAHKFIFETILYEASPQKQVESVPVLAQYIQALDVDTNKAALRLLVKHHGYLNEAERQSAFWTGLREVLPELAPG